MINSEQLKQNVVKAAEEIRATNPMAGSITNTVTIDFVANAQLAVGGSAAMVYLPDEGEALVAGGGAIYLNMGTLFPIYEQTIPRAAKAALANCAPSCSKSSSPTSPPSFAATPPRSSHLPPYGTLRVRQPTSAAPAVSTPPTPLMPPAMPPWRSLATLVAP